MTILRRHLLGIAGGVALAGFGIAPALAGPTVAVTWDPAGSSPAMNGSSFTFSNANISDYDAINIVPGGVATVGGGLCTAGAGSTCGYTTAIIPLTQFTNSVGGIVTPSTYDVAGGFDLYGMVTATAIQSGTVANNSGTFTSANFTLYGDPGDKLSVSFSTTTGQPLITDGGSNTPVPPPSSTDIALATGHLACLVANANCQNSVYSINGVPGAAITTTFSQEAGQSGFFVSPAASVALNLFGSFINNANELVCYDNANDALCGTTVGFGALYGGAVPTSDPYDSPGTVLIQLGNFAKGAGGAGGGSVNFEAAPVPEPASLSLLGAALLGLAGLARRRKA